MMIVREKNYTDTRGSRNDVLVLSAHVRDHSARSSDHAKDIRAKDALHISIGGSLKGSADANAGIIDERIDPALLPIHM